MNRDFPLKDAALTVNASETFYKALLENASDGTGIIDIDGTIRYHSSPVKNLLGYEDGFQNRLNIFEMIHAEDAESFKTALRELSNTGAHGAVTIRLRHRNGSWKYISARLNDLRSDPAIRGIVISYRDITIKQTLRKALEESEQRYKSLIESSFDGITVVNYDGTVKYHSPSLLRILGYRPESGVGKSILESLHPDDIKIFREAQQHWTKSGDRIFHASVRFKHKNESWVILEIRAMNLMNQAGVEGFLISYRDITESKNLEKALQESEQRYRNLVSTSPVGIFRTDTSGSCIYVNEKYCELSGSSFKACLGNGWTKTLHPDDVPRILLGWKEAAAQGRAFEMEHRLLTSDKKIKWVYCQAVPEKDEHGNVVGHVGTVTDITGRVKAEEALQLSEERYKILVANAPETIFIIDSDTGEILDFTDSAQQLFGYSRSRLLRMKVPDLSPEYQPNGESSYELLLNILRGIIRGNYAPFEWYYLNSKGNVFPCEVRLAEMPSFGRRIIRAMVVDITEKKELERKLRQQEKDYEHLASISPVGIFKSDNHGRCTYVNQKWCEMTGLSVEEALGSGWEKAIHPDDRKVSLKGWDSAVEKKKESITEFRFLTPQGKTTWVYGHAKPDFDTKGNCIGYVGSVTDVTEIVAARNALAASEQTKMALLNTIPDMMFRLSKKGVFLDYKAASGFAPLAPPETFLGKKVRDVMPPDIAALCMKNLRAAFATKSVQTYSYSLPTPDGSQEALFEARIVCNDNGEAVALIRDITQQKKAELALKDSEERWKSLVTNAPQIIATIDSKNRITFVNNQVAIMNATKKITPKDIIGRDVFEFSPIFSVDEKKARSALKKARTGKKSLSFDMEVKNTRGEKRWFNVSSAPVRLNGKVEDLLILALDITRQKAAEQELRATNEKLKALYQRLETIREEEKKSIAMEVHDELGQYLTAMKLGIFWMQQYIDQHKQQKGFDLLQVENKVKALIELSSQTISSARKLAYQLRPVVLDSLGLIPAIEWQIKTVNESGKIKCKFSHNVKDVKLSDTFSVALFRIVQESLTNILRHSEAEIARVTIHLNKTELLLAIEDNGKGIEEKELSKAGKFGIFGMRERAKTWNGRFEMKKAGRKGCCLQFTFPLKEIIKKKHVKHPAV